MKNASLISILLILFSCNNEKKYNLLFILVDDLGWTDVSYNYSDFYETSHIDKLSETSMLFDNAYAASSVCSPTRASIMTGKHPARVNITDWIPGLDPKNNHINEIEVILEIMHSIKRAGADSIITYHAIEIAKYFKDKNV